MAKAINFEIPFAISGSFLYIEIGISSDLTQRNELEDFAANLTSARILSDRVG